MVLIIGILACVAVPRLQFGAVYRAKADAMAQKVVTDLRWARAQAILHAAENTNGFALNMTGASPYGGYEMVDLSDSSVVTSHDFPSTTRCTGGTRFEFGPLGNVKDGSDTQLQISSENRTFTIMLIPATGMVKCVAGN